MNRILCAVIAFVNVVILKRDAIKSFDDWASVYRPQERERLQLSKREPLPQPVFTSLADDEETTRKLISASVRMRS